MQLSLPLSLSHGKAAARLFCRMGDVIYLSPPTYCVPAYVQDVSLNLLTVSARSASSFRFSYL